MLAMCTIPSGNFLLFTFQDLPNDYTSRNIHSKNYSLVRSNFLLHTRRNFTKSVDNVSRESSQKIFVIPKLVTIGVTLTSGTVLHIIINKNKVQCQAKKTRMAGYQAGSDKDLKFDLKLFWAYLKPHILYFIAAIVVTIALINELHAIFIVEILF